MKTFQRLLPLLLFFGGLGYKLWYLDGRSLANDEPFSVYHAQLALCDIIKELTQGNNPPLYEMILHFWVKCMGISTFSVRLPSCIFSALTGIFIFLIGKKHHSIQVGIVSCLAFTFSDANLLYAHTARAYALLVLLCCISFYLLLLFIKKPKTSLLILLASINAIMLYTHYISCFIYFAQLLTVLLSTHWKTTAFKHYLVSLVMMIILSSPILVILIKQSMLSVSHGTWVEPPSGIRSIYYMLWRFFNVPLTACLFIVIIIAVCIKAWWQQKRIMLSTFSKAIIIWSSMLLVIFVLSFKIPLFMRRYVLFTSPALCILASSSIHYLFKNVPKIKLLASLLFVLIIGLSAHPNKDNDRHIREMVAYVKETTQNFNTNDIIIFSPTFDDIGFCYYYAPTVFQKATTHKGIKSNIYRFFKENNIFPIQKIHEIPTDAINRCHRMIFIDGKTNDINIETSFRDTFTLLSKRHFHEIHDVYLFAKTLDVRH